MKKFSSILLIIICCVVFTLTCFAHPGRTDSNGGHHVTATGEYHYHHGYPEHYHTNGICPYEDTPQASEPDKPKSNTLNIIILIVIGIATIFLPALIIDSIKYIKSKSENRKKKVNSIKQMLSKES